MGREGHGIQRKDSAKVPEISVAGRQKHDVRAALAFCDNIDEANPIPTAPDPMINIFILKIP